MIDFRLSDYIRHAFGDMDGYLDTLLFRFFVHPHNSVLPHLYFERNIPSLVWNELKVLQTFLLS